MIPSGLVITLFPTPEFATATNIDSSGAHVTESHWLSTADVLDVQVMPLGLVITRLIPPYVTATKSDSSGAHTNECQSLSAALARVVQT